MMAVTRKQVQGVLDNLGVGNKFSMRTTGFEGTTRPVVTIKDWTPNPLSDVVVDELRRLGVITSFKGSGFIQ